MDQYQLQWNHFEDNLATSFKALRDDCELFDVTLACDDDQVEAHKMILSASSSFFKRIIKRNPHSHPLLYLKGVKVEILKSMLDFMYLGKTNVAQDEVDRFLILGEELGIKGLVRNQKKEKPKPDKDDDIDEDTEIDTDDELSTDMTQVLEHR